MVHISIIDFPLEEHMHFQKFQVAFYNLSGDIDDEWWTLGGIHGTTFLKVWMDGSEVWMMH